MKNLNNKIRNKINNLMAQGASLEEASFVVRQWAARAMAKERLNENTNEEGDNVKEENPKETAKGSKAVAGTGD